MATTMPTTQPPPSNPPPTHSPPSTTTTTITTTHASAPSDTPTTPLAATLHAQIALLTSLHTQFTALRQIPPSFLSKSPLQSLSNTSTSGQDALNIGLGGTGLGISGPPTSGPTGGLRREFGEVKAVAGMIVEEEVQDALRAAGESLKKDGSELERDPFGREARKRRRRLSPTVPSPRPYSNPTSSQRKSASLFPIVSSADDALRIDALGVYIREFNRAHKTCKLRVWRRTQPLSTRSGLASGSATPRGGDGGDVDMNNPSQPTPDFDLGSGDGPIVLRFTIPDVVTAYANMAVYNDNGVGTDEEGEGSVRGQLVTESLVAFAPRERKAPHSQSDFVVYQSLSQQIAKMLQSHPRVSVQSLVDLLCSYEGIFIDRCTICERVLSAEGHVPPVVRIWLDGTKEGEGGCWSPRHVSCR